jgi:hypothetical protein
LFALGASPATAGPEGGSVVGGAATIQGQGGPAVIVNQSTGSAVINWNTFNIRANESVRFKLRPVMRNKILLSWRAKIVHFFGEFPERTSHDLFFQFRGAPCLPRSALQHASTLPLT